MPNEPTAPTKPAVKRHQVLCACKRWHKVQAAQVDMWKCDDCGSGPLKILDHDADPPEIQAR